MLFFGMNCFLRWCWCRKWDVVTEEEAGADEEEISIVVRQRRRLTGREMSHFVAAAV